MTFAIYYDPGFTIFNSTIYMKEVLEFDYDQIAVDDMARYLGRLVV
jgi:hypothetical protein